MRNANLFQRQGLAERLSWMQDKGEGRQVLSLGGWNGPDGDLGRYITEESRRSLDAYRAQPNLVDEHANEEHDTAHGGYQDRQLFELIQNSAAALWRDPGAPLADATPTGGRGRIEVRLTARYLYCADDGEPIAADGAKALMFSRLSPRRSSGSIITGGAPCGSEPAQVSGGRLAVS